MRRRLSGVMLALATLLAAGCGQLGPVAKSPTSPAANASPFRCSRVELAASPAEVIQGQPVTFTARAYGCTPVDYRFIELDAATGNWMVTQDWSPSATWIWNTTAVPPGEYSIVADARARDELGDGPDVSISTPFAITGPAAASPSPITATAATCRLPVSGPLPGSGGFIQMPSGAFSPDPASNVPFLGQPDQAGLRRGYTYDPVHRKWLPVPRDWVMPDYSSYIYIGTEYPKGTNQPSLHMVELPSGTDTVWPNGEEIYGYPIALRPEGVYGAPGPEIITMVDPTGLKTVVDQGHNGEFAVITKSAIFATAWSTTGPTATKVLLTVERIDPNTQAATAWFSANGQTVLPIGADVLGNPIVAVGTQLPNGKMSASQIWIVPPPNKGPQPQGEAIYNDPAHPLTILGTTLNSAGGIWIETDQGLWVFDGSSSQIHNVSSHSGYIAGSCL